jgi:hypothetical protein
MKYELQLDITDEQGKFVSFDTIKADNMVHLVVQFQLVIANAMRKYYEKELEDLKARTGADDDIPF